MDEEREKRRQGSARSRTIQTSVGVKKQKQEVAAEIGKQEDEKQEKYLKQTREKKEEGRREKEENERGRERKI